MDISIIPWQKFLEALQQQQSTQVQLWLRQWLFTNEGAMLADDEMVSAHSEHLNQARSMSELAANRLRMTDHPGDYLGTSYGYQQRRS